MLRNPILILAAIIGCSGCSARPEPATVPTVDLERYQGRWYEVARLPNRFERGMMGATATYTLRPDGTVGVVNAARRADGSPASISGYAWLPDPQETARLRVRFFWPLWGSYWVIGLDPGYRWAVVGHPSRDYLWYLARTPAVDADTWSVMDTIAREAGYDPQDMERVVQP